jgi:hypothetical protein
LGNNKLVNKNDIRNKKKTMNAKELYLFGIVNKDGESFPKEWNWEYCRSNKIPFILASLKDETEYSHIKIDLDTIHDGLLFEDSSVISESWQKLYEEYASKFNFPNEKRSFIGTETSFGIIIWSKDVMDFAPAFSRYIMEIVSKYGKIDLLLAEHDQIHSQRKMMTMGEVPFNKSKFDKLTEQQVELRYKIWDKDFNRINDYDEDRIIPFND